VASSSQLRTLLGAAIRDHRKRLGLTQQELADKIELSPNFIGTVERGEEHLSMGSLEQIAAALGVGIGVLFQEFDSHASR